MSFTEKGVGSIFQGPVEGGWGGVGARQRGCALRDPLPVSDPPAAAGPGTTPGPTAGPGSGGGGPRGLGGAGEGGFVPGGGALPTARTRLPMRCPPTPFSPRGRSQTPSPLYFQNKGKREGGGGIWAKLQ